MMYRVMVTAYGYANIEADSEDEALEAVNSMDDGEFVWDNNWSSDDAEIVEEWNEDEDEDEDED